MNTVEGARNTNKNMRNEVSDRMGARKSATAEERLSIIVYVKELGRSRVGGISDSGEERK